MAFDLSRTVFDPWKNYSGVVMEQGRVQLDSDWNEWLAELARRVQAETLDLFGHAAYPPTTPAAFQITADVGAQRGLDRTAGRMYVDGLLAENHGDLANDQWDPALAELLGSTAAAARPAAPAKPEQHRRLREPAVLSERPVSDRQPVRISSISTCGCARSPGSRIPT